MWEVVMGNFIGKRSFHIRKKWALGPEQFSLSRPKTEKV